MPFRSATPRIFSDEESFQEVLSDPNAIPFGAIRPEVVDFSPFALPDDYGQMGAPTGVFDARRRLGEAEVEGMREQAEAAGEEARTAISGSLLQMAPRAAMQIVSGVPLSTRNEERLQEFALQQAARRNELEAEARRAGQVLPARLDAQEQEELRRLEEQNMQRQMDTDQFNRNLQMRQAEQEVGAGNQFRSDLMAQTQAARRTGFDMDLARRGEQRAQEQHDIAQQQRMMALDAAKMQAGMDAMQPSDFQNNLRTLGQTLNTMVGTAQELEDQGSRGNWFTRIFTGRDAPDLDSSQLDLLQRSFRENSRRIRNESNKLAENWQNEKRRMEQNAVQLIGQNPEQGIQYIEQIGAIDHAVTEFERYTSALAQTDENVAPEDIIKMYDKMDDALVALGLRPRTEEQRAVQANQQQQEGTTTASRRLGGAATGVDRDVEDVERMLGADPADTGRDDGSDIVLGEERAEPEQEGRQQPGREGEPSTYRSADAIPSNAREVAIHVDDFEGMDQDELQQRWDRVFRQRTGAGEELPRIALYDGGQEVASFEAEDAPSLAASAARQYQDERQVQQRRRERAIDHSARQRLQELAVGTVAGTNRAVFRELGVGFGADRMPRPEDIDPSWDLARGGIYFAPGSRDVMVAEVEVGGRTLQQRFPTNINRGGGNRVTPQETQREAEQWQNETLGAFHRFQQQNEGREPEEPTSDTSGTDFTMYTIPPEGD